MAWGRKADHSSKAFREKIITPADARHKPKPSAAIFPGKLGATRSAYHRLGGDNELNNRYGRAIKIHKLNRSHWVANAPVKEEGQWGPESKPRAGEDGAAELTDEAAAEIRRIMYRPRMKSARQTPIPGHVIHHYNPGLDPRFASERSAFDEQGFTRRHNKTFNAHGPPHQAYVPPYEVQESLYRPQAPPVAPNHAHQAHSGDGHAYHVDGQARLLANQQLPPYLLSPISAPLRQPQAPHTSSRNHPSFSFHTGMPSYPHHDQAPTLHSVTRSYAHEPMVYPPWSPYAVPPTFHPQHTYPPPWAFHPWQSTAWPYMTFPPSGYPAMPVSPPSKASRASWIPQDTGEGDVQQQQQPSFNSQAPRPFVPKSKRDSAQPSPTRQNSEQGETSISSRSNTQGHPPTPLKEAFERIIAPSDDEVGQVVVPHQTRPTLDSDDPEIRRGRDQAQPAENLDGLRVPREVSSPTNQPLDARDGEVGLEVPPVEAGVDESYEIPTDTDESEPAEGLDHNDSSDLDYVPIDIPCTTPLTSLSFDVPSSVTSQLIPKPGNRRLKRQLSKGRSSSRNSLSSAQERKRSKSIQLPSNVQSVPVPQLKSALRDPRTSGHMDGQVRGHTTDRPPCKKVKFDLLEAASREIHDSQRSAEHDPSIESFSDEEEDAAFALALHSGELEELEKNTKANAQYQQQMAKAKEDKWIGATEGFFDTVRAGSLGFQVWRDVPETQIR